MNSMMNGRDREHTNPIFNDNKMKLGVFGFNASNGCAVAAAIAQGFSNLGFGKKNEPTPPVVENPKAPANDNFDVAAFSNLLGTQIAAAIKPVADRLDTVTTEFATIKGKLEATENTSFSRQPATGGGGNAAHETDC